MKYSRTSDERAMAVTAASCVGALLLVTGAFAQGPERRGATCAGDSGGIALPRGFCATVFADNIGHARHLVVAPNGTVYVNTWSGPYYKDSPLASAGFLVALQDKNDDGRADVTLRFGETLSTGGHGGTGIGLYRGALYAEIDDRIVRYTLRDGEVAPMGQPEVIVSGLPVTGDHPMHPFAISGDGHLFVDLGSATNTCEVQNRMPRSPGHSPCTELETRGGIWRYDATKTGQRFSPAERFATGLRNAEGIAFDAAGRIYATQHGRDQLSENWPHLYRAEQGQNLPAEVLVELKPGADYGWPECYFDTAQQKLVLAPEYGGDGGKTAGLCAQKTPPVAAFPAHWAPNDLKIYTAAQFPAGYRGGALIAFHGSWNRAPGPQGGYNIVFQPLADGKAAGPYTVFADGFAGAVKEPGRALYRPSGLAIGPDGALFVSDDVRGRIWRITFEGGTDLTQVEAAPTPTSSGSGATSAEAEPPEGIHPDAGRATTPLPTPPGATREQVALGRRLFLGEVGGATCGGCHGSDAEGTPVGPDLTSGTWLWGDGSLDSITRTIVAGVPHPKKNLGAMPPLGGVELSQADVAALAAYVWALGHQK
jgi:glucose/arabinose dehydrogenase/mono/diheme cytochrome c family protein